MVHITLRHQLYNWWNNHCINVLSINDFTADIHSGVIRSVHHLGKRGLVHTAPNRLHCQSQLLLVLGSAVVLVRLNYEIRVLHQCPAPTRSLMAAESCECPGGPWWSGLFTDVCIRRVQLIVQKSPSHRNMFLYLLTRSLQWFIALRQILTITRTAYISSFQITTNLVVPLLFPYCQQIPALALPPIDWVLTFGDLIPWLAL